jgi:hypothetical protein
VSLTILPRMGYTPKQDESVLFFCTIEGNRLLTPLILHTTRTKGFLTPSDASDPDCGR